MQVKYEVKRPVAEMVRIWSKSQYCLKRMSHRFEVLKQFTWQLRASPTVYVQY